MSTYQERVEAFRKERDARRAAQAGQDAATATQDHAMPDHPEVEPISSSWTEYTAENKVWPPPGYRVIGSAEIPDDEAATAKEIFEGLARRQFIAAYVSKYGYMSLEEIFGGVLQETYGLDAADKLAKDEGYAGQATDNAIQGVRDMTGAGNDGVVRGEVKGKGKAASNTLTIQDEKSQSVLAKAKVFDFGTLGAMPPLSK